MSDAWQEIQAVKSKRNSLREKLQKRKIERQVILNETVDNIVSSKCCVSLLALFYNVCQIIRRFIVGKFKLC